MGKWHKYSLLLSGIGISYFGNWIYLIALNILVLDMTGSAAAVAGIYVVGPAARLLTNFWAGSIIDRMNKRKLMIASDIVRGALVLFIPFMSSIWIVYVILFIANIAGSFFGPSSTFYITKFVASEERKRFNSIMSMLSSGSFLIGPAIAGVLIVTVGTDWCVYINAISFFICAVLISMLPDVEDENLSKREPLSLQMIMADWKIVRGFVRQERYFIKIYILFQTALMIAFSLDSQEVTYIKQHLGLSDELYGLIVSLAGVGSILGATVSAMVVKSFSLQTYLAVGMLLTTAGYTLFYSSFNFLTATLSFVFLGFFMSFANTGYSTFYQNNVPTQLMGRFGSLESMFQSAVQIGFTALLGVTAEWFDLQMVTIVSSVVSVIISVVLLVNVFQKSKQDYYAERT